MSEVTSSFSSFERVLVSNQVNKIQSPEPKNSRSQQLKVGTAISTLLHTRSEQKCWWQQIMSLVWTLRRLFRNWWPRLIISSFPTYHRYFVKVVVMFSSHIYQHQPHTKVKIERTHWWNYKSIMKINCSSKHNLLLKHKTNSFPSTICRHKMQKRVTVCSQKVTTIYMKNTVSMTKFCLLRARVWGTKNSSRTCSGSRHDHVSQRKSWNAWWF